MGERRPRSSPSPRNRNRHDSLLLSRILVGYSESDGAHQAEKASEVAANRFVDRVPLSRNGSLDSSTSYLEKRRLLLEREKIRRRAAAVSASSDSEDDSYTSSSSQKGPSARRRRKLKEVRKNKQQAIVSRSYSSRKKIITAFQAWSNAVTAGLLAKEDPRTSETFHGSGMARGSMNVRESVKLLRYERAKLLHWSFNAWRTLLAMSAVGDWDLSMLNARLEDTSVSQANPRKRDSRHQQPHVTDSDEEDEASSRGRNRRLQRKGTRSGSRSSRSSCDSGSALVRRASSRESLESLLTPKVSTPLSMKSPTWSASRTRILLSHVDGKVKDDVEGGEPKSRSPRQGRISSKALRQMESEAEMNGIVKGYMCATLLSRTFRAWSQLALHQVSRLYRSVVENKASNGVPFSGGGDDGEIGLGRSNSVGVEASRVKWETSSLVGDDLRQSLPRRTTKPSELTAMDLDDDKLLQSRRRALHMKKLEFFHNSRLLRTCFEAWQGHWWLRSHALT